MRRRGSRLRLRLIARLRDGRHDDAREVDRSGADAGHSIQGSFNGHIRKVENDTDRECAIEVFDTVIVLIHG
jgi:hypothetical protein